MENIMRKILVIAAGLVSWFVTVSANSHHSFSAEFDIGRPVNLVGEVKEFEWTNPHAWLHMEVTDERGDTQSWAVEMVGVNALVLGGMSPETLKPGDKLTVTGFGARNGTNTANASSVNRTDTGESLWSSTPPGGN
jgi:hypothetical protein